MVGKSFWADELLHCGVAQTVQSVQEIVLVSVKDAALQQVFLQRHHLQRSDYILHTDLKGKQDTFSL